MTYRTFEGMIHNWTAAAVEFEGVYWTGTTWFPKSQIEVEPDGDNYIVRVKEWLCAKNDIPEFTYLDEAHMEKLNAWKDA